MNIEARRKQIEDLITGLNAADVIQDAWYRRNNAVYSFVCYLNITTGLFLSNNYAAIPTFLRRANSFISGPDRRLLSDPYHERVSSYLSAISKFLLLLPAGEVSIDEIPTSFLK